MKKFFLTLGVAALSLSSFASERILYQQNFETVPDVAATGWTCEAGELSIASDDFGKFLSFALQQNNGRSAKVTWGQDIFLKDGESVLEDGTYTMAFDFSVAAMPNNQWNSEITVFTNHTPIANNLYRLPWSQKGSNVGPWDNFILDISQCNTAVDADMLAAINAPYKVEEAEDGTKTYTINTDESSTIKTGEWYTATMYVNVEDRTVEYDITSISGDNLTSGSMDVPAEDQYGNPISMYAEGIYVLAARYQSVFYFDNIKISYESSEAFANPPTVALTSIGKDENDDLDLNMRTYTITFLDGETLHLVGTDGAEETIEWADCEGAYKYSTKKSGVMKSWTECDGATSEIVETEVDCSPCVLPVAEATITSVSAGFGKTYTLTVSNSDTPLRPTIFINYEYVGKDGTILSAEDQASGVQVTVPGEGVLKVSTAAFGYQGNEMTVENDVEFAVKKTYDFARMDDETLTKAGFTTWNVLNSGSTSGFNNWTARKRLFYYDAATETTDAEGKVTYTAVYPFGFIAEDNTTNVINYSEIGAEGADLGINVAGYELFEGIRVFAGHNVSMIKHVGVYNNATSGGNNKNIDVLNLNATDFVVANTTNSYGSNSCHPVVNTVEEYYAQFGGADAVYAASAGTANEDGTYTVSIPVYRIDTACTKVTVFSQVGESGGVDNVAVDEEQNNDPYYYTIDGLRLEQPTRPGFYIHQGKKIIVK
ncbi:MAG: hypothetical protein NC082_01825 [Clostridiales bacterium]|nr:hypothetical protein [Clostridiales bacterium]